MNGSSELQQLAHLLRIGAETARDIAELRPCDAAAISKLAEEALDMAKELDEIAARHTERPPERPAERRA